MEKESDKEALPQADIIPSPVHPGGFTFRLPQGLEVRDKFSINPNIDLSFYPEIPPGVQAHIRIASEIGFAQFAALLVARPSEQLFINSSEESAAVIEAYEQTNQGSMETLVDLTIPHPYMRHPHPKIIEGGLKIIGVDAITEFLKRRKHLDESVRRRMHRRNSGLSKSGDPRLIEWMENLGKLQRQHARSVWESLQAKPV